MDGDGERIGGVHGDAWWEFFGDGGGGGRGEDTADREDDVDGAERRAIGEEQPGAEVKGRGAAIGGELPALGEGGLDLLGAAVDADEDAAGQIADQRGDLLVCTGGVEGFGVVLDGPG